MKHKEIGYRTWTEDDIAAYRKCWPMGSPQRTAFEVLLHTGLRRSDAVKLGRQHMQDGTLQVSLRKSGGTIQINIPVHPTLRSHLATLPKDQMLFITTRSGVARSEKAFTNWVREAGAQGRLAG